MGGVGQGPVKLAGKVRPVKPKNISGASQTDPNKWDYIDGTAQSNMDRGQDPTYAIPRDSINADLRITDMSTFIRLVGDSFIPNVESQINLLSSLASLVGSGPLTNNNSVTFALDTSDDESPIWNNTVANFASASSQYLSLPTASAVQVGTGSFTPGIAFQTSTTGALQVMFSYGSHVAAKAYWEARISSGNQLQFEVWDGTTTNTVTDAIANRWQDGRWHFLTTQVDNTGKIILVEVDGILIGTVAITYSSTLTVAGENLYIGAYKNSSASVAGFWNGRLGFFKLINNAADYNVGGIWNRGITEAVSSGTFTVPTTNSSARLNNVFGTPNTNSAYFYSLIFTEDGEYEIQIQYLKGSAAGKLDLIIDGNTIVLQLDTYNGSTTYNNSSSTGAIKLSAGPHTVKILNDGQNGSSSGFAVNIQWINFIKRGGHEKGGLTSALLLGDEITSRSNNSNLQFQADTAQFYNNSWNEPSANAVNGDYEEGSLFIKGGYYRIDYIYATFSSAGKTDLWFGNTQILNALDTYSASNVNNVVTTVYKRLQQGKQDIRRTTNGKNASSTGYRIYSIALRIERLTD